LLADLPPCHNGNWTVKTPKLFHFDPEANNQIQELVPNALSLKNYALKHYAAPTPAALEEQCVALGQALGGWLKAFHAWSNHPDRFEVRELVSKNKQLQDIKHMINYRALLSVVDKFPAVLGSSKELFEEIRDETAKEIADDGPLSVIHGDFWTGKLVATQPSFFLVPILTETQHPHSRQDHSQLGPDGSPGGGLGDDPARIATHGYWTNDCRALRA
jgi:hypothetical protein